MSLPTGPERRTVMHRPAALRRRDDGPTEDASPVPAWVSAALMSSRTVLCYLAFLALLAYLSTLGEGMDARADSLAMWGAAALGMVAGKSAAEHIAKARAVRAA